MKAQPWLTVVRGCSTLAHAFRDVLFPRHCLICNNYVSENYLSDQDTLLHLVHDACADTLAPAPEHDQLFDLIRKNFTPDELYLSTAFARYAVTHDSDMSALIHGIKYGGHRTFARSLGRELARSFIHCSHQARIDAPRLVIVPIPIHKARLRERGYNQAEEIATGFSEITGIDVHAPVIRIQHTSTQTQLHSAERHTNVMGAFQVVGDVMNAHILLMDDVLTTGSTTNACAEALLRGGARTVHAVAIAAAL